MLNYLRWTAAGFGLWIWLTTAQAAPPPFPPYADQAKERTCFQTGGSWSGPGNLRSDVAIVYGIDPSLPERIKTWRDRGYRIHVMTGVAWGSYQDYLYGRFDGINHEDEAQTERNGKKISHGGDIYYMCPGTNYGKFLCVGIQRALDAGAEAIHLEEPEFWVRGGYSEGFKREWRSYYGEEWAPPHSSVDAQWRASKLKYFLYRRALQQVFDYVQDYNRRSGRQVRCYVPTHSLLSYAHWRIVSPESSLARLNGCDGYIAQVWTGTARTRNLYQGKLKERTFETAFLEYGAMQNLVRATGRRVWYLNDPVEDDPNHDWDDYRRNWESTLVASLFQPDVWHFEVAPWPERVFAGEYPRHAGAAERVAIPPPYATELQTVMHALNDLEQPHTAWDGGTSGLGAVVSDSLMFERGDPRPSDAHMSHFYGLTLPLLKRGMPVRPIQLENLALPNYLKDLRLLLLTYRGMKPLTAEAHAPLVDWVKRGGVLVVVDDDGDPYNSVREWWNTGACHFATPREHLFQQLGIKDQQFSAENQLVQAGRGKVIWLKQNPAQLAAEPEGDRRLAGTVQVAARSIGLKWIETNYLLLRRGPYLVGAGLDESVTNSTRRLTGRFVNLFDPELKLQREIAVEPDARLFLLDVAAVHARQPQVLAASGKALPGPTERHSRTWTVEGVPGTKAVVLVALPRHAPRAVTLEGQPLRDTQFSESDHLLWIRFANEATPRKLRVEF